MFADLKGQGSTTEYVTAVENHSAVLVRTYPGDHRKVDGISNHFTEDVRVTCRVGSRPSPADMWEDLLRTEPDILSKSLEEQRETVYSSTKECNAFNPTYVKWIVDSLFAGRTDVRMLDPSAGWGDRLIGALASGKIVEYLGFDPNVRLQDGYGGIIETFGNRAASCQVIPSAFERIHLRGRIGSYDLVLTSPPYFTAEVYSEAGQPGHEAQSIVRWPRYEDWTAHMYKPYLKLAWDAVRPGGWAVFYVEDVTVAGQPAAGQRRFPKKLTHYRLRKLTHDFMTSLSGSEPRWFGLKVVSLISGGDAGARTRWSLAWKKT